MDWKDTKTRLDDCAKRAREREGEVGGVLSDAVTAVAEELDHLHKSVSHMEQRLAVVTSQVATLEARVHEEVE